MTVTPVEKVLGQVVSVGQTLLRLSPGTTLGSIRIWIGVVARATQLGVADVNEWVVRHPLSQLASPTLVTVPVPWIESTHVKVRLTGNWQALAPVR